MNKYAYIRVSSKEQETDRQRRAMEERRIPEESMYIDKVSGKNFDRPAWKRLKKRLRKGDHLYVHSIDRFGRNYEEIIEEWRHITKDIGAHIIVLDMPLLDTTQFHGLFSLFIADLVLQILSFMAEFERRAIRKRQREGIDAARSRGVTFGRARREMDKTFYTACRACRKGRLSLRKGARRCGLSYSTFRERYHLWLEEGEEES